MKLVWHIVAKDVRRLSVAVGVWLTFIVASAVAFANASLSEAVASTAEALSWINYVEGFAFVAVALQQIAGVLLAAVLVIEDAPADTKAFWPTRPISGARLLVVKIVGALLLFVIAPTAALVPVWLASGFSAAELRAAIVEYAQWRGIFTLVALPLAALAHDLARFLALVLGVIVLAAFVGIGSEFSSGLTSVDVQTSAAWLAPTLAIGGIGWILFRQYAGPRRPAWASLFAVVVLAGIVPATLPWGAHPSPVTSRPSAALPEPGDRAVLVRVEKIVDRSLLATLAVTAPSNASAIYAPDGGELQLTWPDRPAAACTLIHGMRWGEDAALQLAHLRPAASAVRWEMTMASHDGERIRSGPPAVSVAGEVTIGVWRGRVMWEIPLRAGAQGEGGSSLSRLVAVLPAGERNEKRLIVLQEHDAIVPDEGARAGSWPRNAASRQDVYLLVNRQTDSAELLPISRFGEAALNSGAIAIRALDFTVPADADPSSWEAGCALIKVRFERERGFDRAVDIQDITIDRGGESP